MLFALKDVYQLLKKLGLCLSHSRTIKLVDALRENHDAVVKEWKAAAENVFASRVRECVLG